MNEQFLPAIVRNRWLECMDNPTIPRFKSLITLLDAFLFNLDRDAPDHAITNAIKGLKTECKSRIKQLMPKENHVTHN